VGHVTVGGACALKCRWAGNHGWAGRARHSGALGSEEHVYSGDLITIVAIVNRTGNKTSQV